MIQTSQEPKSKKKITTIIGWFSLDPYMRLFHILYFTSPLPFPNTPFCELSVFFPQPYCLSSKRKRPQRKKNAKRNTGMIKSAQLIGKRSFQLFQNTLSRLFFFTKPYLT